MLSSFLTSSLILPFTERCYADMNPVQVRNEANWYKRMSPEEAAQHITKKSPGDQKKILAILPGRYKKAVGKHFSPVREGDKPEPIMVIIPDKLRNEPLIYVDDHECLKVEDESVAIDTFPDSEKDILTFPSSDDVGLHILDYPENSNKEKEIC